MSAVAQTLAARRVVGLGIFTPQLNDPLSQGIIVAVAVVMILIGAVPIRHALAHWRGATQPLNGVTDGPVRASGTVRPSEDGSLVSPLSGEDVVLYDYEIHQYVETEDDQGWEQVAGSADAVPFALEDGSGVVGIDPAGSTLLIETRTSERIDLRPSPATDGDGTASSKDESAHERLARKGLVTHHDPASGRVHVGSVSLHEGSQYRLVERRIEPGDDLVVTGTAHDGDPVSLVSDREDDGVLFGSLFEYPFVVADAPEHSSTRYLLKRGAAWAGVGGIGLLLGLELELLVPTALVFGVLLGAVLRSPGWCWVVTVGILLFGQTSVENTSEPLFFGPAVAAVALSLVVSVYTLFDDERPVSLTRDRWQPSTMS